jgi:hypothetical protein
MSSVVKAKILNITYDRENNLFQLSLRDVKEHKHINIAVKGTDWGVTQDIPDEIIEEFCKNMIGQEKNLHVETEQASLRDAEKDDKGIVSQEEINRVHDNLSNYPIDEVMNVLHRDIDEN